MIISTDYRVPCSHGDMGLSAASGIRRALVGIRWERRIAPFYAPSTGAVRPQAGVAAMADRTRGVAKGKGLFGVPSWSPPV